MDTASDESEQALSDAKKVSSIYAEEVPLLLKFRRMEEAARTLPKDAESEANAPKTNESPSPANKTESEAEPSDKPTANVQVTRNDRKALLEQIDGLVDGILAKAGKTAPKSKSAHATLKTHGIVLSGDQSKIVESIEDSWDRIQAGAVLKGPYAAGRTVLACSLLWRHRMRGPQLVLSSFTSQVRQLHVLALQREHFPPF